MTQTTLAKREMGLVGQRSPSVSLRRTAFSALGTHISDLEIWDAVQTPRKEIICQFVRHRRNVISPATCSPRPPLNQQGGSHLFASGTGYRATVEI
jgi:hypothetical protein